MQTLWVVVDGDCRRAVSVFSSLSLAKDFAEKDESFSPTIYEVNLDSSTSGNAVWGSETDI